MYSNRFVVSLKVGGKILRETSGAVSLPFGSEYEILLKNLNSRRALVKVSVDGQDATEATKLVLEPNSTVTLERFIKNGNLNSGNRFKFIERTSKIEDHRGIKEDDGLVRAEFWAEKEVLDVPAIRKHYYDEWHPRPWYPKPYYPKWPYNDGLIWKLGGAQRSLGGTLQSHGFSGQAESGSGMLRCASANVSSAQMMSQSFNMAETSMDSAFNDAGITVPGSESNQQFKTGSWFETESNSSVIVLQLKGVAGSKPVSVPITVDLKPVCPTCGTKNPPNYKFCGDCGTHL